MEDFEITVDKANEVEIVVYDKQVNEPHAIPIGLLWIKISDLVEALRRQKVMVMDQGGQWVPAGAIPGEAAQIHPAFADMNAPLNFGGAPPTMTGSGFAAQSSEGIDAWFAVEPAGAICLNLNFSKRTTSYFLLRN